MSNAARWPGPALPRRIMDKVKGNPRRIRMHYIEFLLVAGRASKTPFDLEAVDRILMSPEIPNRDRCKHDEE